MSKVKVRSTRFAVLDEVKEKLKDGTEDSLCLQIGIYLHPYGHEPGIRFMRRGANSKMKAQRGQANCLSLKIIKKLVDQAESIWR